MFCVFNNFQFVFAIATASLNPITENKERSCFGNIFNNLKDLKTGVLKIISPELKQDIPTNQHQHQHKPPKNDTNPGVFSPYPGFILPTTQAPKKIENHENKEDVIETGLYREDVVRQQLHFKKTRKIGNGANNSIL